MQHAETLWRPRVTNWANRDFEANPMRRTLLVSALLATAMPAAAQITIATPRTGVITLGGADDPRRAMLGVGTAASGRRDTLGVLVTSVTPGGPAEKAGIEEGNRLASINGVSLKLAREDADDDYMQGVAQNRLQREMRKVKAGDSITLEVWGGGRTRSVTVRTVAAEELDPTPASRLRARLDDRPALGLYATTTGSKRDTAGVFVQQVVEGGPAEKAGIAEGDRIASVNGVDLRVPREDAGDWGVSSSRVDRLQREIEKQRPGDVADLVVVSGGRSRPVKVTLARSADMPSGFAYSFRTGPGGVGMFGPGRAAIAIPKGTVRVLPKLRIERRMDEDIRREIERSLDELDHVWPQVHGEVMDQLQRELPRAMDELHYRLPQALDELHYTLPRALDELRLNFPYTRPRFDDAIGHEIPLPGDGARPLPREKEKVAAPPKAAVRAATRVVL
jgi:hypothetical protein